MTTIEQIQAELVRLGVASTPSCEGLDVVDTEGTPAGQVTLADTESITLPAPAVLAALRGLDAEVPADEIEYEGSVERAAWVRVWGVLNEIAP